MTEIERREDAAKPTRRTITAHDIVKALVDGMEDMPITSRARGMIGKQAKELLHDGFRPEIVYAAAVIALRRSQPHVMHHIAQDMALVEAGKLLTRSDYEQEISAASQNLDLAAMRQAREDMRERLRNPQRRAQ